MAAITDIQEETRPFILTIQEFLPYKPIHKTHKAAHIAVHLRQLLAYYNPDAPNGLLIPSAVILADFYQGTIKDVLDALHLLHLQCYHYRLSALDTEITLHDPLKRHTAHSTQKAG